MRVKAGVSHPNYPDIPLGGWTGEINDVDAKSRQPMYEVNWSRATLSRVHPIYEKRCERDGRDSDSTWLREIDLENDPGDEPVMEQPTRLQPRPLNLQDPHDVCRKVFGLTSDDEAPPVNEETLRRYHQYLSGRLRLPQPAVFMKNRRFQAPSVTPVILRGLAPVEQATTEMGLFAEVTLEGRPMTLPLAGIHIPHPDGANPDLMSYHRWLTEAPDEPFAPPSARTMFLVILLVAAAIGLIGGALVETVPGAHLAARIGATLFALLGAGMGAMLDMAYRRDMRLSPGFLGGACFGMLVGACIGVAAGCVVLAYPGAVLGGIAAAVLVKVLAAYKRRFLGTFKSMFVGAVLGAVGYAFYLNARSATSGAIFAPSSAWPQASCSSSVCWSTRTWC